MKKLFIVANWKSNMTSIEAGDWLVKISNIKNKISNRKGKEIIVCPAFTLLNQVESGIRNHELGFETGAQNISPFDEGQYTGEVSAKQIKEFADYVIIGHSERRSNFNETDELVNRKIEMALKNNLMPIVCVSSLDQVRSLKVGNRILVAYEPLFAIGSGTPDTPQNTDNMAKNIREILGELPVLYGGSVTSDNIKSFTQMPNIDGVLVGKASLTAPEFLEIISNA